MRLKARIYPIPIYFDIENKQEWCKIHKDRFKLDTLVFLYKLL